jgi:tetratricopeptide (TPR) repeat protein
MSGSETQKFTLRPQEFDLALLPPEARTVGSADFRDAVRSWFEAAFQNFSGRANIAVTDCQISVSWTPDPSSKPLLQQIVDLLQHGRRTEGMQLLEMLHARDPDHVDVLYNLGIVLSDVGRLDEAECHLRRCVQLAPRFAHALIALGIALTRQRKNEAATEVLRRAVDLEPENLWARKNLGVMLLKQRNAQAAVEHLAVAVEIDPQDQGSWVGLGDAARMSGTTGVAERSYRQAIGLNEHNDLAEAARDGLTALASAQMTERADGTPNPKAIEYCAAAIKMFSALPVENVKAITAEISILGRSGLDVNNQAIQYSLKNLPGSFTGLELVCYLYAGVQMLAPGTDVGVDLSREYEVAREASS